VSSLALFRYCSITSARRVRTAALYGHSQVRRPT
jgi:hypothetical protein